LKFLRARARFRARIRKRQTLSRGFNDDWLHSALRLFILPALDFLSKTRSSAVPNELSDPSLSGTLAATSGDSLRRSAGGPRGQPL
jgi:hypothetical protein